MGSQHRPRIDKNQIKSKVKSIDKNRKNLVRVRKGSRFKDFFRIRQKESGVEGEKMRDNNPCEAFVIIPSDEKDMTPKYDVQSDAGEEKNTSDTEDVRFEAFIFSRKFFSQGIKSQIRKSTSGLLLPGLKKDNYLEKIQGLQIKGRAITTINNDDALDMMSEIYKDIITILGCEAAVSSDIDSGDLRVLLSQHIINIVKAHYPKDRAVTGDKHILFMQGPVGSYKNRLLQYVYLYLCGMFADETSKKAPVFYIDFSKYETDGHFDIETDIKKIDRMMEKINDQSIPPLFILDNVRGFQCGNINAKYDEVAQLLNDKNVKVIVSKDTDFNQLAEQGQSLSFGEEGGYKNNLRINSVRLSEEGECKRFIKSCIDLFINVDGEILDKGVLKRYFTGKGFDDETFYKDLIGMNLFAIESYQLQMNLFTIDAYQLKLILKAMAGKEISDDRTITLNQVYSQICSTLEINVNNLGGAMFDYEYNQGSDIEYGSAWYKAIQHKSILEYCIARYYYSLISRGQFKEIPNNILTDGVGRFIRLEDKDRDEIKGWVESNYKNRNMYYKLAQLIFLMGCSGDTKKLLGQIKEELLSKLETVNNTKEQYKIAIVLRTIYVMLIYSGDTDAAKEYFYKLIRDEDLTHANVNRGFSLDYYGDTKYIFRGEDISDKYQESNYQQDKLFSAANTLSEISFYIGNRINKMQQENKQKEEAQQDNNALPILILQLITYYQVLQIEKQNESDLRAAREWLQEILRRPSMSEYPDACEYFKQKESDVCEQLNKKCIKQDITEIGNCGSSHKTYKRKRENEGNIRIVEVKKQKEAKPKEIIKKHIYLLSAKDKEKIEKYNIASRMWCVKHSQWKDGPTYKNSNIELPIQGQKMNGELPIKGINVAESVAEHAFNCWLLGYIFLPEFIPHNLKYDKQYLLNLLATHCFTEIVPKKGIEFTQNEDIIGMQYLLGKGKYFNDWKTIWGKNNSGTAEQDKSWLMIASDIDEIQTVYQYFRYYCNSSKCVDMSEKARGDMLERLEKLHTDIGKRIAKNVILLNEEFLKNNNDELREVFYDKYIEF